MKRPSRRVAVGALTLVVLAVAAAAYVAWPRESRLERAAALLPPDTLRVTWTDWAAIREELDAEDLKADDADDFLAEAAARDVSSASATVGEAAAIFEAFGFSPVTSDWEILGQGPKGMVLVLGLADGTDVEGIADKLDAAGFAEPDEDRLDGGIWEAGPDVLAGVPGLGEPVLQHIALLEDERLLVASAEVPYLERSVPVARGDEAGLDIADLTAPAADVLAAVVLAEDHACEELSMASADDGAQSEAERLVADAGGVSPLTGYLVALRTGDRMTVAFDFESDDQARHDERSRRELAAMDDPGQFVSYPDLFTVEETEVDGSVLVLDADLVDAEGFPLANTTQGPVLLASC